MKHKLLFRFLTGLVSLLLAFTLIQCRKGSEELIIVPDLRGKPLEEAIQYVENLPLRLEFHEGGYYASVPQNYVVSQVPYPLTKVKKGRTIKLEVSKGASMIMLPSFIGMKFGEAHELIEALGLSLDEIQELDTDKSPGTVLEQFPEENMMVTMGSGVRLTLALPGIPLVPDWIDQHFEEVRYSIIEHGYILGSVIFKENSFHPRGVVYVQEPVPYSPAEHGSSINLVVNEKP